MIPFPLQREVSGWRFGDFILEPHGHSLRRNEEDLYLRPKSFETLSCLIRRRGYVVTKEELLNTIWAGVVVTDGVLTHCIEEIRIVLGDDAHHPRFVQTVPRIGYKFIAAAQEIPSREDQGSVRAIAVDDESNVRSATHLPSQRMGASLLRRIGRRRVTLVAAIGLLCGVVAFLLSVVLPGKGHAIESVAVLPFANLNSDPGQEYFADGLTEELTAALAKVRNLRVISRTSAMQYKGAKRPVHDIAGELGVDAVIEGSVLRSGGTVRITAQLIRAEGDYHLWGETYERDERDVLVLLRDAARTIALQIQGRLTPQDEVHLAAARQVNPASHEAYLKGCYFLGKRTSEGFRKGIEYFERSVLEDPGYAEAYAGLADCYNLLGDYDLLPPGEAFPRASAAARRALEIQSSLPEAHASLGFARMHYDRAWEEAEREFRRATELDPNYAPAHHWYALFLAMRGRVGDAREEIQKARTLDPLSLIVNTNVGWLHYFAREYDAAIAVYREILQMDPTFVSGHVKLAWALEQTGRCREAIAELQTARNTTGNNPALLSMLAHAYALGGDTRGGMIMLDTVFQLSSRAYLSSYHVAVAYAGLGETDAAFHWLHKACDERNGWLVWLTVDPKLDGLRHDPRFDELVLKMGL